jgi:hypothetical protein
MLLVHRSQKRDLRPPSNADPSVPYAALRPLRMTAVLFHSQDDEFIFAAAKAFSR